MYENKQKLYDDQKKLLDTFLNTGAIDKAQYEKSLNGLKEKMGIDEYNVYDRQKDWRVISKFK